MILVLTRIIVALPTLCPFLALMLTLPDHRLLAAGAEARDAGQPTGHRELSTHGIRLAIPDSWAAVGVQYSVMHYRDVFLCMNSAGDRELRVTGKRHRSGGSYNSETVAQQLKPGTVYIDVAHFDIGEGPHYGAGRTDSVASDLSTVLKEVRTFRSDDGSLTGQNIPFIKWGRRWSIYVYFREPVTDVVRKQASEVLQSIRFDDVPRDDPVWAVGAAWRLLPPEAQPGRSWPARNGSERGLHRTNVEKTDEGYLVTFHHLDEQAKTPVRSWSYLVSEDGKVARR